MELSLTRYSVTISEFLEKLMIELSLTRYNGTISEFFWKIENGTVSQPLHYHF
jgi:hypothetical protein